MPKITIELLKKLGSLGFTDRNFSIIHHLPNVTRQQHSDYCGTVGSFRPGTNENVRLRLAYIMSALDEGSFDEPVTEALFRKLANQAIIEVPFKKGNSVSSNAGLEKGMTKKVSTQNLVLNSSTTSGIYVAYIHSEKYMPVTRDKRYVDTCARVNKTNVKIGKAKNFKNRHLDYCRDFDKENVEFIPLAGLLEIDLAERAILKKLHEYRLRSPKGGLMDWLENVDVPLVVKIVYEVLESEGFEFRALNNPFGINT